MRIKCPYCGTRDLSEFSYAEDATLERPAPDADQETWNNYVYLRDNPRGWLLEYWQHGQGCRSFIKVKRHTVSHQIDWVGLPHEMPPEEGEA